MAALKSNLILRIQHIGVYADMPLEMAQRVRLSNLMGLCPMPVFIYYLFYGTLYHSPPSIIMAVECIAITIMALWCNSRRRYHAAKIILFSIYSLNLFIASNIFNVDHSMTAFYFPLFFAYALFYDFMDEWKVALPLMCFTLLCCVGCFVLPKYLFYKMLLNPHVAFISNNYIHYICSFFISFLFIGLITRMNAQTQRKLIAAKEEAVKASQAKTVFLSNMSHELRTPLTGIIGTTHLLLEAEASPWQKEYFNVLHSTSQHMLGLVNEVLDFSKIEAGKMKLSPSAFHLKAMLENIAAAFTPQLTQKGLLFHAVQQPGTDRVVNGDEMKLRQVLTNLLSNAYKFTDKGSVRLELSVTENANDELLLTFSVADTGIGIKKEMQQEVFNSFTQAESGTDRRFGGTGLGLAISSQLIILMGGTLQLESEPGRGSRFYFTVPVQKSSLPAVEKTTPAAAGSQLNGFRILIAEDNPLSMKVMLAFLNKWGIEAVAAVNGLEALDHFKQNSFDLLLLDLEMPGMDGIAAIKEIRKTNTHVQALAFTAAVYPDMESDLMRKGFNGYINKPVNPARLHQLLQQYLLKNTQP
jgi:signal transduction histidine kinase